MQEPSIEYTAKECFTFLKKEIKDISHQLSFDVKEKNITPEEARLKYDYYLNIYQLVEVCLKMEESESYMNDRTFSLREIYRPEETSESMLTKAFSKK
mgnify:CR=1 FL=1|jgi:hypothetical protein